MDKRIEQIRELIRAIPDFPKPGILFRDITPFLASPTALAGAIALFAERYAPLKPSCVVAIESRGFVFGAPLALELGVPLRLVRKPGKLPGATDEVSYQLEYGTSTLQMHRDELTANDRVLVIDDLLATGGTAAAAGQLIANQGAKVLEYGFIIELADLNGRAHLGAPVFSLVSY